MLSEDKLTGDGVAQLPFCCFFDVSHFYAK